MFRFDMASHFDLKDPSWKSDVIPEIMDGKNIWDFVDPDIMERLDALERCVMPTCRAGASIHLALATRSSRSRYCPSVGLPRVHSGADVCTISKVALLSREHVCGAQGVCVVLCVLFVGGGGVSVLLSAVIICLSLPLSRAPLSPCAFGHPRTCAIL